MAANRWPTGYLDPADIRAAAPLTVVRYGACVVLVGLVRMFVIHIEEFGAAVRDDIDEHQTTRDRFLIDTVLPRSAPMPGFAVDLTTTR